MTEELEKLRKLRADTGVSVIRCRQALREAGGDIPRALAVLKEKGRFLAEKKAGRQLGAGTIGVYLHGDRALGALVRVDCETDFVAKNDVFRALAEDLAMQVSAFNPQDPPELLAQPFLRDETMTIADRISQTIQQLGERIEVVEFCRLAVEKE